MKQHYFPPVLPVLTVLQVLPAYLTVSIASITNSITVSIARIVALFTISSHFDKSLACRPTSFTDCQM